MVKGAEIELDRPPFFTPLIIHISLSFHSLRPEIPPPSPNLQR